MNYPEIPYLYATADDCNRVAAQLARVMSTNRQFKPMWEEENAKVEKFDVEISNSRPGADDTRGNQTGFHTPRSRGEL